MKVGTDSIMLGSWVQTKSAQHILDVGSGSGLLAIMLAQKAQHSCLIDGIDIDFSAITQAKSNAKKCPWTLQLTFKNSSLQQLPTSIAYDLIVSNPPYFSINLSANNTYSTKSRINARQTVELDHPTLLKEVTKHLSTDGKFCCVLPFDTAKVFIVDAESVGLYCIQDLHVKPNPQSNITRLLLEFSRTKETKISTKLSIYNHLGSYSDEYIALCKDYYLNF
jgi:tRNA1Val (adenine37-N6)-methyltransferase